MRVSLPAAFLIMMVMSGFVRPASATPISYTESVSGDLPAVLPATTVFTLDVGVNTVSGTSMYTVVGPGDFDSFAFTVPVGMVLTDISYAFERGGSATGGGSTTAAGAVFELTSGNAQSPLLDSDSVDLFGASPKVMFASGLPLSAGTYGIDNFSLSGTGNPGSGWTDDYTWSLTVASTDAPVPEPASLLLLGSGLVGAGVRRWRTRRTAA